MTRTVLCPPCARSVLRADVSTSTEPAVAHAFALYGGAVAEALRRFKYGERPDLAAPLGQLVRRAGRDARVHGDLVVPVPLHVGRLLERGYNQAALLAAHVADEIGAPLAARGLSRTRRTPQQAALSRAQRLENVTGAFCARRPELLEGRRIVLVDDVATTGATLAACEHALLEAGARAVSRLVVARAEA